MTVSVVNINRRIPFVFIGTALENNKYIRP